MPTVQNRLSGARSATTALLEVTRGPLVEEVHRGHVAVVDAAGTLLAFAGDPHAVTFWRSAAKPFQAMPLVATGAAARFGLTAADLAIASGSHNGEPVHVERVRSILERIGCDIAELACGTHPPLDRDAAAALAHAGATPSPLHNNCSGKHAGMLALAKHLGVPTDGYARPDHPVQRAILDAIERCTGLAQERIALAVDGCGVACFGISVALMARAYAVLMRPDALAEPYRTAARTIRDAMVAEPYLVAGARRLDTALMTEGRGLVVAKGGASGVLCVGTSGGIGVAVKLESGPLVPGFAGPIAVEALRQSGALDAADAARLAQHVQRDVLNVPGDVVGHVRTAFTLSRSDA